MMRYALRLCSGGLVWVAAAALLFSAWRNHFDNGRLRREIFELLEAREYPYMMSGLYLDVDQYATRVGKSSTHHNSSPRRQITLVSSDYCQICERNVENWKALLSNISVANGLPTVNLVSFDEGLLFKDIKVVLEARQIPYQAYSISNSRDFSLRTGIVGVPLTLAMSKDNVVEAVHSGILSESTRNLLVRLINDGQELTKNRPFLRPGEQQLVKHNPKGQ